ncbi:MAG: hypothetical protein MEQ07_12045 [Aquimonas sp.]|nr:hypothetical protein [Aquimonas sp.]
MLSSVVIGFGLSGCHGGFEDCSKIAETEEFEEAKRLLGLSYLDRSAVCSERLFTSFDMLDLKFAITRHCERECSDQSVPFLAKIQFIGALERAVCDEDDPYFSVDARHGELVAHFEQFSDSFRAFEQCVATLSKGVTTAPPAIKGVTIAPPVSTGLTKLLPLPGLFSSLADPLLA